MSQLNRLASETSPYLLQHAQNPVDWYTWNDEALEKAKRENKPILLSIGYAACHWCHVMAHESFEDLETAKLMNQLFVNIKVDREERPDIDKVYQTAHYLLTQKQGGWPLTVFLTPSDLVPFFSGTYFPREARYELPNFKDVLRTIAAIYQQQPDDIKNQNQQLIKVLNHTPANPLSITLNKEPLGSAQQILQQRFDSKYGGFGSAPKFPHPTVLEFLLKNKSSMAQKTMHFMANGGIYDQIQGGFFRYAVDDAWQIPHFEKMLYDNAQLLALYALAAKQLNEPVFSAIAKQTADWVITKMQSSEGGYYSSLDADSEGHEGKFYLWDKFEIEEVLDKKEFEIAQFYFGILQSPNFENCWHLHVENDLETVANKFNMTKAEIDKILVTIKQKLLAIREKRTPPACDKKILTSWNSLMIKSMIIAGEVLNEPRYTDSALKALKFIQQRLWINNRLMASYKDGKAKHKAYLDDYAFLLDALTTLISTSNGNDYLKFATQIADNILNYFTDKTSGGFFFTADDHEKILYRPKIMMDEAMPAGNGIAAQTLIKLGNLINEKRYIEAAENTLKDAWPVLTRFPAEHCSLLIALANLTV